MISLLNAYRRISTIIPATSMTVRDAINSAINEELKRDPSVFLIGEEVGKYEGSYKITKGLFNRYGADRIVDTPITEAGFCGAAVGSAFVGLKPICEFMTFNFALQAIDHIINSAAKTHYMSGGMINVPIVFRGPNGVAAGVSAQHSQCFAHLYSHIPGLKVLAPYDSTDARGLLKAAIRDPNPVVFLEHELLYGETFEITEDALSEDFVLPMGKAKIMRDGNDVTLLGFSNSVRLCIEAATILERDHGVSAEVVNLRSLRPFDKESVISSVCKTHRVVCVEEGWKFCGIGAELSAICMEECFDYLDAPVARICGTDIPMPYSISLEKEALPKVDDIVNTVLEMV